MVPIISTASSHSTREILWASCAVINKVTTQQAKGTHHNVHATSLFSVFVQDTADLPGNGRSNLLDTWYWSEFVTQLHSAPQLSHSTNLCISQSACVANHIDTAGSNDRVKMLLMFLLSFLMTSDQHTPSSVYLQLSGLFLFVCLFRKIHTKYLSWVNESEVKLFCGGGKKIILYVLALPTRSQQNRSLLSLSTIFAPLLNTSPNKSVTGYFG